MAQKPEIDNEDLLQITEQYVAEVEAGQQPQMSEYIRQYPQYAEAIADFVAYYQALEVPLARAEGEHAETDSVWLAPAMQTALETARERVYTPAQAETAQKITSLLRGNEDEQTMMQLSEHLHLSKDVVMLLEQRQLDARSIPLALQRRLAVWLREPVSSVQRYFLIAENNKKSKNGEVRARVAEKALRYPFGAKRGFLQALEESAEATEEQKAFWRECVEQEQRET